MRGGKKQKGYTIVEVMVFMAVSSFMFVIAVMFINGKQDKAEFRQGLNSVNSKILSTLNDISNGYYPDVGAFGASPNLTGCQYSGVSGTQGKRLGCVFMGKVLKFNVGGDRYSEYTVGGLQYKDGTTGQGLVGAKEVPENFDQSKPTIYSGFTQESKLQWGVQLIAMKDLSKSPVENVNGLALFNSFGSYTNKLLNSGAQSSLAFPMKISGTEANAQDILRVGGPDNQPDPDVVLGGSPVPNILMCFASGSNGQFGTIRMGGKDASSGQRFALRAKIYNEKPSICN